MAFSLAILDISLGNRPPGGVGGCFSYRDLSTNETAFVIGSTGYTTYVVAKYVCGYLARADGMGLEHILACLA